MNQSHDAEHRRLHDRRPFHKDWRVWTAVVLILAAMASYILTNDEVMHPTTPNPQGAPAGPSR